MSERQSLYVDKGNARCVASNGIRNGEFAEWVSMRYLVSSRPADPGSGTTGVAKAVSQSDDFRRYEKQFVAAAKLLLDSGRCTLREFQDMGGWVKSTTTYRDQPVYFTYCGGMTAANRIYLNVSTGRIWR